VPPAAPEPLDPRGPAASFTGEAAWFALLFTHATVMARIDAALTADHGISFSACEILCRLKDAEPTPVRRLADELVSVSPTRASRLIQELVDAGHLQRGADQRDGRISLISLTPSGQRYAAAVVDTFAAAARAHFVDLLDDDDLASLVRIWRKLQDRSSASGQAGATVPRSPVDQPPAGVPSIEADPAAG
jgi:DNA-binding MarR family transcriptional regulator